MWTVHQWETVVSGTDTDELIQLAIDGDGAAADDLFARHRQRLRRVIDLRLRGPLQRRLDASDILQEVCLEASRRLTDFSRRRPCSFYLWLRMIAGERLIVARRRHLGTLKRDAARDVPVDGHGVPLADSRSLIREIQQSATSPSGRLMRKEEAERLHQALEELDVADREVLTLRHFEHLSNTETAIVLGVPSSTASSRYVRALDRLQQAISDLSQEK